MLEAIMLKISSQSPWLGLVCMIVGVFIPKLLEHIFKSKERKISERESSIKRLTEVANDLYEKLDKVDDELDEWKDKYYQLQKDFNTMGAYKLIAMQKMEEAGIEMNWPCPFDKKQKSEENL